MWQNTVITIILQLLYYFQLFIYTGACHSSKFVTYIRLCYCVGLLLYPLLSVHRTKLNFFDLILGSAFVCVVGYCGFNYAGLLKRAGRFTDMDICRY